MQTLILARQGINGLLHSRLRFLAFFRLGHFLHLFALHLADQVLNQRVRRVDHQVVLVGHLAVERHTLLVLRHLFHTTHELILRQEDGQRIACSSLAADEVAQFIRLGQQTLKGFPQTFFLLVAVGILGLVLLANQVLYRVRVDTYEAQLTLFGLLLKLRDLVYIQLAVHQQHIVAFLLRAFYKGVVRIGVLGVEGYQVAVLVGLGVFDLRLVLLQGEILALNILQEGKTDSALVELLIGQHTKLDKELDIIPFLLEVLLVVLVHLCQFVSHLFGDVTRDLLDVIIRLQVRTADIQRYIRRVDHAVQQRQVLRHDILHLIGHKDLIAIELYLVALYVQVRFDAREIQYSGQVEGIVHIEVNMEQRFIHLHGVQLVVERLVVLILQFGGLACPGGVGVVDDVLLAISVLVTDHYFFAVFPFLLHTEGYLHGQELAVLTEQRLNGSVLQVLLELFVDMQDDIRSAL